MGKRGKQITHWGQDEQKALWALGRGRKLAGTSWEMIAAAVSKVRRVERTAAACAAYYERELSHFDEYPPKRLHVTVATTAGKVLSTIMTERSLGELEEFAAAPAVRPKETGHGRRSKNGRNDART